MIEILTLLGLLAGGLIAAEIGFRVGAAYKPRHDGFGRQFDVIRTATFAFVAFLIAFAFSGAGERYVNRLDVIVEEANALGTAWLRADILPDPQRAELKAALRDYTADRVAILASHDRDEVLRMLDKVDGLHARMWSAALAGTKGDAPLMALVLPPLNAVIDLHTTHLSMARRHLPLPILVVLVATATLSLVLVGFGNGQSGRRHPVLDATYALVLGVGLLMTIDLDRPRQGLIEVSNQPLVETLAAMR